MKIINKLPFNCKNWLDLANEAKEILPESNKLCFYISLVREMPLMDIFDSEIKSYAEECFDNDIVCYLMYEIDSDFLKARCFEEIYEKLPDQDTMFNFKSCSYGWGWSGYDLIGSFNNLMDICKIK